MTSTQDNNWPNPDRPGVPVEPERDGLPSWEQCEAAVKCGDASPMQRFIYEHEPAGGDPDWGPDVAWRALLAAAVEAAERRGYELAGCASADAIPSIAKLIERAQLALSEPPLTMCEALARDVALKPLAMECAAAVEKARAEEREACAKVAVAVGDKAALRVTDMKHCPWRARMQTSGDIAAAIRARGQA